MQRLIFSRKEPNWIERLFLYALSGLLILLFAMLLLLLIQVGERWIDCLADIWRILVLTLLNAILFFHL